MAASSKEGAFASHPASLGPSLCNPVSQPVTAAQFDEPAFLHWCRVFGERPRRHRKLWEYAIAMQALARGGMLCPGRRGLGFGVGKEPLTAVLAAHGVEVLATDAPPDVAGPAWTETDQHALGLSELNTRNLCPEDMFRALVRFRFLDMRAIPCECRDFDFCWSLCALEHLGSWQAGLDFINASLDTLKPGGLAVHTTELACHEDGPTLETSDIVVYRRRHLEEFAEQLRSAGHHITLDLRLGETPFDRFVDTSPYREEPHLRLRLGNVETTSVVLIIRKGGAETVVLP